MSRAEVDTDGTVRFWSSDPQIPPMTLRYGSSLLNFESTEDGGFVADYRLSDGRRTIEARDCNGMTRWMGSPYESDAIEVMLDRSAFSLNRGAWVKAPGPISRVRCTRDRAVVLTDAASSSDGRNIYGYNRRGHLVWQIEPQNVRPFRPYDGVGFLPNGNLAAEGTGFCSEIDPQDGHIVNTKTGKY